MTEEINIECEAVPTADIITTEESDNSQDIAKFIENIESLTPDEGDKFVALINALPNINKTSGQNNTKSRFVKIPGFILPESIASKSMCRLKKEEKIILDNVSLAINI